jgi:hexosaminidase
MALKNFFRAKKPVIKIRCVHFDLKGTPPTPQRLLRLLHVFAAARYNAVLVEWEDTFPWTVDRRFRSETAYSPETVKKFVKTAEELGMEIIPLVQCLGHMETPLRLPEYARLREVPYDECNLNPLAPGARELVEKMVDDVLRLMPDVRYFHLGGDEAWTFGTHPDTKKFIAKHGKGALYLHHVEPLLDKLNARNIRPMLWHDMMRDWDANALRRLAKKADLVVWGYGGHPDHVKHHYRTEIIKRFVRYKVPLWGATAYKGSNGSDTDLPNFEAREENALAWAEVAQRYGFKGVMATAWSRTSTNVMQYNPIEGALDSAFNVGAILHDGRPPRGGRCVCVKALKSIGEGKTFITVSNALTKLSNARHSAWNQIRFLRQLTITVFQDRRRLPCFRMVQSLRSLQNTLQSADEASHALRAALRGLMEKLWVERYLAERIEPLREEFSTLKKRTQRFNPAAYRAMIGKK